MKKIILIIISLIVITFNLYADEIVTLKDGTQIVIYENNTWKKYNPNEVIKDNIILKNKKFLRENVKTTKEELYKACELYEQGWYYTMPMPKSAKAAWGVSDGRTTWYNGWWYNSKTNKYSIKTPFKTKSGIYIGDDQNVKNTWRNGGSPSTPDVYMFLLSKYGGPRI